jgi:hypothetical protein
MFLSSLIRIRKTIGFRLTVWYSLYLISSCLLIFGALYLILSNSVKQSDYWTVRAELMEFASHYNTGGIDAVRKQIAVSNEAHGKNSLFVRLYRQNGESVYLTIPDRWAGIDFNILKKKGIDEGRSQMRIYGDNHAVLEIAALPINDDLILQVGRNLEAGDRLLERFRNIFSAMLIPIVAVAFVGGAFLAARTLRPVRDLIHAVRRIDEGRMDIIPPRFWTAG